MLMNNDLVTSEVCLHIRSIKLQTHEKTIDLVSRLAEFHFLILGRTSNPFCQYEESLEFEAYRCAAELLHKPQLQLLQ